MFTLNEKLNKHFIVKTIFLLIDICEFLYIIELKYGFKSLMLYLAGLFIRLNQ